MKEFLLFCSLLPFVMIPVLRKDYHNIKLLLDSRFAESESNIFFLFLCSFNLIKHIYHICSFSVFKCVAPSALSLSFFCSFIILVLVNHKKSKNRRDKNNEGIDKLLISVLCCISYMILYPIISKAWFE